MAHSTAVTSRGPRMIASPTFTIQPQSANKTDEELADVSSGFGSDDLNPRQIGSIQSADDQDIIPIHSGSVNDCTFQTFSTNSNVVGQSTSSSNPSHNSFCTSSTCTPHMKDRMRRKLRYFFMNPYEKWVAKRRFPWKLGLQLLKIFIVTLQLILFGMNNSRHHALQENTEITLRQLLLKEWDSLREIESYPPSSGPYAVYKKSDFYSHVDYVIVQYYTTLNDAIGSYGYDTFDGSPSSINFCKKFYHSGKIWPFNSTLDYDSTIKEHCLQIPPILDTKFSIEAFLKNKTFDINFDRLISVHLKFGINTVFLKTLTSYDTPECYRFNVNVLYDNSKHDGQMVISLTTASKKLFCHSNVKYQDEDYTQSMLLQSLNVTVLILCCLSFILCCRSLYKGQCLYKETTLFFRRVFGTKLSLQDRMDFIDFWYVMIIVNDCFIIIGTALKIEIELKEVMLVDSSYHDVAMLLGCGSLLVFAGVLRYLGFFAKYNLLILTLKRALPNVLRFMLCCILLYAGFCFCGWVVLGPYHIKFRHLSTTSECLFALMNGDDMFATFAITHTRSNMVWWFSRFYLYGFICLFIYVIISIFISVIMDSYETVKHLYKYGFPLSELHKFINEHNIEASSGVYRLDQRHQSYNFLSCFSPCCRRNGYEEF